MKTATLLFTYKRSKHTKQVIDALSKNSTLPDKLFVFQDGKKTYDDAEEWGRVNDLIRGIDWCDTDVIVSEYNKGLAASIIAGVTYAFEEYETVIVLEDDCVPAVSFMDFMQLCFEKYQNNTKVHSVSGYAYPVSLSKGKYDVYGCGRISSWGWGTWKDRWDYFKKDYEYVRRMKQEETASRNLAMWGSDLESMLVGNIRGDCDSWAVFWALDAIIREKVCVNPYDSLIRNIGLDGSGVHCGCMEEFDVVLADKKRTFQLPDEIGISDEEMKAFISLFGSYTALNLKDGDKENILIYGLGNFYLRNESKICEKYYVQAFVDQWKHGWYAGKKVIMQKDIELYDYDHILVMIQDTGECLKVVNELKKRQIDPDKILIGGNIYEISI